MIRRLPVLLAGAALAACNPPSEATWVSGFGYGWVGFNHRLSYVSYGIDGDDALVSVVGGTSTTDVEPVLPDTCDPDACIELPFADSAEVHVDWTRAVSKKAVFGRATASLVADADGETTTLEVPLDRRARGEVTAWIAGFTVDTDHLPSGGEACYDPALGWHPRHLAIALDEAVAEGRTASVDVTGLFAPGLSLEAERACVDEIVDQALVPFTVDVVVAVGDFDRDAQTVEHGMSYTYGCDSQPCFQPDPQPDPDLSDRPLSLDASGAAAGWTAIDFRFHQDDPDDRGAYLRTLSARFDLGDGWASGHATNYSPVTQLSGFDYTFTGRVEAAVLGGSVEQGEVDDEIPVELESDGTPSVFRLPL